MAFKLKVQLKYETELYIARTSKNMKFLREKKKFRFFFFFSVFVLIENGFGGEKRKVSFFFSFLFLF